MTKAPRIRITRYQKTLNCTLSMRPTIPAEALPIFDQMIAQAKTLHVQGGNRGNNMRAGRLLVKARKFQPAYAQSAKDRKQALTADKPPKKEVSLYEKKRLLTLALRGKLKPHVTPLFDPLIKAADGLYEEATRIQASAIGGKKAQKVLELKRQAGRQLLRARRLAVLRPRPVYKTCAKCHRRRKQCLFYQAAVGLNEVMAVCKKCEAVARVAWEKANPEKDSALRKRRDNHNHLQANFGLTVEQFEQLCEKGGSPCQICKRPERQKRRISLDHDHATGRLRGILCSKCNTLLGYADDDPSLLESAASYLRTADLGVILSKGRSVPIEARLAGLREDVRSFFVEFSVERHLAGAKHV